MSEHVTPSFFSTHERYSLIIVGVFAFMLGVHGYSQYFPLLAISKIRNQLNKNSLTPIYGA